MADIDLMLQSFSASIPYIEKLTTGAGYILGIYFIFSGIVSVGEMSDKYRKNRVTGGWLYPMAYLAAGSALLWLPTTVDVLNTTFFGSDSLLAYSQDVTEAMKADTVYIVTQIVEMMGVFWIVHGFTLFVYSTKANPNDERTKHDGRQAWVFIIGGLFAMNNQFTFEMIKNTLESFVTGKHELLPIQQTISSWL